MLKAEISAEKRQDTDNEKGRCNYGFEEITDGWKDYKENTEPE